MDPPSDAPSDAVLPLESSAPATSAVVGNDPEKDTTGVEGAGPTGEVSQFRSSAELQERLDEMSEGDTEASHYDPGPDEEDFTMRYLPAKPVDQFETMEQETMDRVFFENSMMSVGASLPRTGKVREPTFVPLVGVRSPSTVLKRARDLQLYVNWCVKVGRKWWPLREIDLLDYLGNCESETRSKFIGKNLLHAVKSFKYVMCANFQVDLVIRPLLQGRVLRVLATRDPTQQARPSTVEEDKKLETMVESAENILDKYFAGCMLFAIYSRARWSDLASMQSFFFDVIDTEFGPFGFVESRTRIYKTSNSAEKKALYLPFVAPIHGVSENPWALSWQKTLGLLGLLCEVEPYGPNCRAPTSQGGFTKRPLGTDEISSMLNDFLGITDTDQETSSHSLKATTFVWCAKYGIDDTSRAMLGHHFIKDKSLACYSRDLLARPLRELCGMLLNIRRGQCNPDRTRSGYMKDAQAKMFDKSPGDGGEGARQASPTCLTRWRLTFQPFSRGTSLWGDLAIMRRLIFEAQTSVIAQSRALADPAADPSTHKPPPAERMARIAQQKVRLAGLDLEGPMEVAHSVYDVVSGMLQADSLKYLNPAKCITRMQEITMTKPPKELRLDSTGQGIMVKDVQGDQQSPVSGELDVKEAMARRSLAFDVVGLADYETFQKWIRHLFQIMRQPAPPGFKQPNITQLLHADRQAFVRMQEFAREGI
eukprot:s4531_g8.t1